PGRPQGAEHLRAHGGERGRAEPRHAEPRARPRRHEGRAGAHVSAERRARTTTAAPRAMGPDSPAIASRAPGFCAGQVGLDPATGRLVDGGIAAETARVLENLTGVLAAAGCGLADVVKTTVFLADLGEFAAMNAVYARFFPAAPPARSTVQVAAL